ncbi:MAG: hypothetical protein LBT01_05895 [Spirochaetaceae bacterium]|jgi:hypothetical protein|nr:hypothetical protein [Spirochaetaceae bacterium]
MNNLYAAWCVAASKEHRAKHCLFSLYEVAHIFLPNDRMRHTSCRGQASLYDIQLSIVRQVEGMNEYDIYDVLVNIAYGAEPQRRQIRAFSFTYKQRPWLGSLPEETKAVILAIAKQFAGEGTEAFENKYLFDAQAVRKAVGLAALKKGGNPTELMRETR